MHILNHLPLHLADQLPSEVKAQHLIAVEECLIGTALTVGKTDGFLWQLKRIPVPMKNGQFWGRIQDL